MSSTMLQSFRKKCGFHAAAEAKEGAEIRSGVSGKRIRGSCVGEAHLIRLDVPFQRASPALALSTSDEASVLRDGDPPMSY